MIFIKSVFFKDGISVEGDYEWEIPSIRNMITKKQVLEFHTPVTFFTGDNGTGKSTLLECIAASYGFNPEGGTRNFCFSTRESHSNIFEHLVISKTPKRAKDGFFYRADSQFIIATHSPILMSYPNSEIYLFGEDELRSVKLEDTDHFILTKAFIEKPQKMISNLLD